MKVAKTTNPKLHWAVRTTLILIGIVIVVSFVLMMRFWLLNHNRQEQIGVSFSQVQAERYGSDWQKNFTSLMDELGFRHIRIAAYWDRLEPQPDVYDFSQTDYMVNEASKRGAKLTMVIGQKAYVYPNVTTLLG